MTALRSAGDRAVLIETASASERRALDDRLLADPPTGLVDQVPGLKTLLLTFGSPAELAAALPGLRGLEASTDAGAAAPASVIEVAVRYDGADLADVADLLGIGVDEVISRHTGQLWTVEFAGFAPGFGYLLGELGGLRVPRLASPRTRVPAGSVALADDFTGVYPRSSPGGWRLIGRTDAALWDVDRTPPALLAPGTRVRFVADR